MRNAVADENDLAAIRAPCSLHARKCLASEGSEVPHRNSSNEIWINIYMAEEIIVSVSPHETRVAVIEQGLLQEVFIVT